MSHTPSKWLAVVALVFSCGGAGDVTKAREPTEHETADTSNDDAERARDRAEDALVSAWYKPELLTGDLRPEILQSLATPELLDTLTLYDLDLDIASDTRSFKLDERVYFQNRGQIELKDIMLRMYANTPRDGDAPEKLLRGHCVQTACTVQTVGRDVIVVHPAQPLAAGARLRIVLHVEGTLKVLDPSQTTIMAASMSSLKSIMGGAESASNGDYGLLGSGDDILSFGNFYPVIARHADDVWDVDQSTLGDIGPDELGHVRAHVELPPSYMVAASGTVTHDESVGGRRRIDYAAGCMRDFALLASDKFTSADRIVDGVRVRSYFRTSDRATGERVLDVAAWSLKDFQKRFGPYPYRELDLVEEALVGGAGGVEFAGLATVASMFYKPSGSASGGGGLEMLLGMLMGTGADDGPMKASAAEFTTAHEVGHQWWHGAVGSDSRKHPWQDEALAQFSAMLYIEDRYGAARAKRDGDMNVRMGYEMMRLLGSPDGAVDAPAGSQSQIVYGGLVYGKGPYYLVALRKQLGDATFFAALQAYVKQYYLGFAPPRALMERMVLAAGKKGAQIAALSHRWLFEAHGDDDLGKANMGELVAMAGGGKGGGAMSGLLGGSGGAGGADQLQQMMKMFSGNGDMMKMLQQMLGGGGQ